MTASGRRPAFLAVLAVKIEVTVVFRKTSSENLRKALRYGTKVEYIRTNSEPYRPPMQSWSPSGLQTVPQLKWGTHLAHFFGSGDELGNVLVPYFKAGLENNERCLWVTGEGFTAEHARCALRGAVPDFDRRERRKQIEIADGGEWYARTEKLRPDELVKGLVQREQDALAQGYAGLRTDGNCAWVPPDKWPDFLDYEMLVQKNARGRRMICMCSYCADQLPHNGSHMEVMERHDMAVPGLFRSRPRPRGSHGITVDGFIRDVTEVRALRAALERQRRSFELVMNASRMGTWRYTLADNICVYDENAQRLYGLTEARFLHDEAGARSKIHPNDLELMWSRVGHALKPESDGRYEVEYRVKHPDGSWRWLSAWGLVEFEGEGAERKPVAIAGASRDLTRRKQAEDRQRLLLDELPIASKTRWPRFKALHHRLFGQRTTYPRRARLWNSAFKRWRTRMMC